VTLGSFLISAPPLFLQRKGQTFLLSVATTHRVDSLRDSGKMLVFSWSFAVTIRTSASLFSWEVLVVVFVIPPFHQKADNLSLCILDLFRARFFVFFFPNGSAFPPLVSLRPVPGEPGRPFLPEERKRSSSEYPRCPLPPLREDF